MLHSRCVSQRVCPRLAPSQRSHAPSVPPMSPADSALCSSDNEQFTVDNDVAIRSVLIKNMIEGARLGPRIDRPR